ncbi:hypothetical protein DYB28_010659, partial [Aphanomyces astaci]
MFHPTAVTSHLVGTPKWTPSNAKDDYLAIQTSTGSDLFWPYSGAIGVHIRVTRSVPHPMTVSGHLTFFISDAPPVQLYVEIPLIPAPPQRQRYPSGYIPHDNLHQQVDPFDSQGDHPHTNFCDFFHRLLSHHHLFVEVLTTDYTCVGDWSLYGVLVIADPEDSWFASEVALVDAAVRRHDGLSVVVIADWFNPGLVRHHMSLWDATTLSTWQPVTGGANVPAINTLLAGFGVGLSSHVWSNVELLYLSGSALIDLPDPSFVLYANLTQDTNKKEDDRGVSMGLFKQDMKEMAIAAMVQIQGGGRIVVYGDSSCVDSSTVSQMEHGTVSMCGQDMI